MKEAYTLSEPSERNRIPWRLQYVSLPPYDARKYKMGIAMRTNVQVIFFFFLSLPLSFVRNNPLESYHYNSVILFHVT
jgi:hypothetical protein